MPSTYTVNLGIEKPATGEQSGTWGDTTNINFDILDQAINGAVAITLASAGTSGSPNTLAISDGAVSDGRNKWVEFVDGGDLGATAYVQLTPNDAEKIVFIRNSLSGSRSVILFQGTYDAARDLEVPAGVDMVVKFSGGGATATATDVFTRLRATAIETPSLTATTADINGGTVDGTTIGGATPAAGTFTNLTANTDLTINSTTTVDGILDEDNMASNSATKLATQQSIKAYVDSQVGTVDTLAEILANGNTSGANNLIIDNGQAITTNTINETTAGSGVTIDSVLLKDDGVNATNLEITNIKANDGTAAGSIANSTGAVTITSFISNSVDIGGGAIDDTTIGGTTPNSGAFTTLSASGDLTVDTNVLKVDTTNNRVGVNVTSPSFPLHARGPQNTTVFALDDGSEGDYRYFKITSSVNGQYWDIDSQGTSGGLGGRLTLSSRGSNKLTISGTEALFNDPGDDYDFRVESDTNSAALFVDAGNSRVGINTSTPNYDFEVNGTIQIGGTIRRGGTVIFSSDGSLSKVGPGGSGSVSFHSSGTMTNTDQIAVFGSSEVVFNEQSYNQDFRVESDGRSHMLFVDAGNNSVGINSSTPTAIFEVSALPSGGATSNLINFVAQDGSNQNSNSPVLHLGAISQTNGVRFQAENMDAYGKKDLVISMNNGTDYVTSAERFRFKYGGGFITSPANGGHAIFNEDGVDADFRVESDTNPYMLFVNAGTDTVFIGYNGVGNSSTLLSISNDTAYPYNYSVFTEDAELQLQHTGGTSYTNGYKGTVSFWSDQIPFGSYAPQKKASLKLYGQSGITTDAYLDVYDEVNSRIFARFATAGSIAFNEDGADMDFRVESDTNAHALFLDASTGILNIGASSAGSRVPANSINYASGGHLVSGGFGRIWVPGQAIGSATYAGLYGMASTYNAYYDGGWKSLGGGTASAITIDEGTFAFSGSNTVGAADSSLTWTNRLVISATGNITTYSNASTSVVFNQDGNDSDFRVESDNNANILTVDAGNDSVLVGTGTYSTKLGSHPFQVGGFGIRTLGIGSTATDTGISINAGPQGMGMLVLASRNTSNGVNTASGLYLINFYYDGNNAPAATHISGSNFLSFGVSGSNTFTIANPGAGNCTVTLLMNG
jgi:hypothetical protein